MRKPTREEVNSSGLRQNCGATLAKTVDDATSVAADAQSSLQLERRQARAALVDAPFPASASPLADRLGVTGVNPRPVVCRLPWLCGSGRSCHRAGIGAHGGRRAPEPVASNVVALTPKPKGDVDRFLLERVKRAKAASVSWAALYIGYRAWCHAGGSAPVEAKQFGAHLDALRDDLGLKVRTEGQDVLFVGLRLAS